MARESVIAKMVTPEVDGVSKEIHHVTEAAAVLVKEEYTDDNGIVKTITTTLDDVINRSKVIIQEDPPSGSCIWGQPVIDAGTPISGS